MATPTLNPQGAASDAVGKQIKYAAISGANSGDNTLVAAVTGRKIRVLALYAQSVTAVTFRLESAAGGTALTGVMSMGATDEITWGYNPLGWVETVSGELLNMELGGAVQVSGCLVYAEI